MWHVRRFGSVVASQRLGIREILRDSEGTKQVSDETTLLRQNEAARTHSVTNYSEKP